MTCTETADLLTLAPLGVAGEDEPALGADEAARLEEHLTTCEGCREVAAALTNAYRSLDEAVEQRTTMEPMTTDLRERTLSAIRDTLTHDAKPVVKKDAPAAVEPGPDPARLEAIGRKIALTCTYCHDHAARDEVLFCASCLAPHHRECFETHGRCTLPGCGETRTVRPADSPMAPARRPSRWLAFPLLASALCAGGIAALTERSTPQLEQSQLGQSAPAPMTAPPPPMDEPPPPMDEPPPPMDTLLPLDTPFEMGELPFDMGEMPAEGPTRKLEVALSPDAPAIAPVELVSIDGGEGSDLAEVMEQIGRMVGRNILVDPSVQEQVMIDLREIPWRDAVDVLARMTRCEVEERPGGILVLTRPPAVTIQFTDANLRTILQLLAAYSGKNLIVAPDVVGTLTVDFKDMNWWRALQVVAENRKLHLVRCRGDAVIITARPLDPAVLAGLPVEGAGAVGDAGPRVSLDVEGAALVDVMEQLGRVVQRNILVDPTVDETLTLSLRGVPLRDAIDACARVTRCQVEERAGGIVLLTQPPRSTLQAADCPATAWFQLLCAAGGWGSIMDASGWSDVTVDLKAIDYETAARLTAASLGVAVQAASGPDRTLSFVPTAAAGTTAERQPRPAPAVVARSTETLTTEEQALQRFRALGLRVQAILAGDERALAVVGGRLYRTGDTLRDEDGEELAEDSRFVVKTIERGQVLFQLGEVELTRSLGE